MYEVFVVGRRPETQAIASHLAEVVLILMLKLLQYPSLLLERLSLHVAVFLTRYISPSGLLVPINKAQYHFCISGNLRAHSNG